MQNLITGQTNYAVGHYISQPVVLGDGVGELLELPSSFDTAIPVINLLAPGTLISSSSSFLNQTTQLTELLQVDIGGFTGSGYVAGGAEVNYLNQTFGPYGTGDFLNAAGTAGMRGYAGFEYQDSDGIHFGWVDVGLNYSDSTINSLTIYGYAFETVAGLGIEAGAVPLPPSVLSPGQRPHGPGPFGLAAAPERLRPPPLKKTGRAAKFRPCLFLSPRPHLPRTNLAEKLFQTNDHFLADTTKNENVGQPPPAVHGQARALALHFHKKVESSAHSHFVILSGAKDLVFSRTYEILRSLRSLRMTGQGT